MALIAQREGKNPPLICNVSLSADLTFGPNRDWDRLAERYPTEFEALATAEQRVAERRPK